MPNAQKHFLKILILSIFLLSVKTTFSQVNITLTDNTVCANSHFSIPVIVTNMLDVDSLRISIEYDVNLLEYTTYTGLNTSLLNGYISSEPTSTGMTFRWRADNGVSMINDTLVFLTFNAKMPGYTSLNINTTESFFYSTSGVQQTLTFNEGKVNVTKAMSIVLTEINSTCSNKCEANYMVSIKSGISPYEILWNGSPGRFDTIQTNLCSGSNNVFIKDATGCELDSVFFIDGMPAAEVELEIRCNDSLTDAIYLENPTLSFSFNEIPPTHVLEPPYWEFGDGDTARSFNPTHTYKYAKTSTDGGYLLKVYFQNENGCDTIIEKEIPIHEAKIRVPNIIVRNSSNESHLSFIISDKDGKATTSQENYITNQVKRLEVKILDRWGRQVYSDGNYKNNWNASNVTDGVYYYTLKVVGFYKTDFYKGSITVITSNGDIN